VVEVVGALAGALPTVGSEHAPQGLTKAAGPGRTRDAALTLFTEALARPKLADGTLRRGLREARHLHSRERRLVADGVNDLLRHHRALGAAIGTDDPLQVWLALLVLYGLPVDDAVRNGAVADVGRAADLAGALGERLAELGEADATALVGSLDRDVAAAVIATWGAATAEWIASGNRRPPTALRAQGVSPDALMTELMGEGIATTSGRWVSSALLVDGRANLEGSAAYRAGRFEIQDEGSQLVAEAVDARGLVVDFCAGAGGKTLALAQTPGVDRVIACDVRPQALDELARRASKAPDTRPQTVVLPGSGPLPEALASVVGKVDRVLVDAPCSGTGVLRRHPAYRLRLDGPELSRLAALQGRILDRAAPLVRPGGWLAYATCSALRVENDAVVEAFLSAHPEFRLLPLARRMGPRAADLGGDVLRLSPHQHGTDGFFTALLERT